MCTMSSKVIDFGTSQKRVRDFLLVFNSNLIVLFCRVWEILEFLYAKSDFSIPHPYSGQNFGVFTLEYTRDVGGGSAPWRANTQS